MDTCCNPPIAYKGPRFQPTSYFDCYTHLESELLQTHGALAPLFDEMASLVHKIAGQEDSPLTAKAKELLAKLPKDYPITH